MKKYFLHNGSENIGPFNLEQLKEKKITKDTPIWYEGIADWTTAGEVAELRSILVSIPPSLTKKSPPSIKQGKNKKNKEKKSTTLRNVLIGVATIVLVFSGLAIFAMINDKPNDSFENIIPEEEAAPVAQEIDYSQIRNAIEEKVTVSTNQYSYDPLGGISNLDVTVNNTTDYTINEVTVAVDYIKDSGGVYKTEYVTLKNIPAHQDKTA
ncbi:DUF4339 domain-containing protein [Flavobacterium sp. 102]|uniref:DUF4339 domain-containing protein n=1 Tax=Flavobacterium sp. 102 TaxID=2135623 RepID=UPI000EAEEA23|nr:DUF4339 domain-containing protein [Flavobacterium sp. 102]RKS03102.1 uncharacterized protein DUF4339 [Flavobacterium sp. 102]